MIVVEVFTSFIYQPFLNLLVGIYWLLQQLPFLEYKDMGIAVIIFTVLLRIILLPISLASDRSETERRNIEQEAKAIQKSQKNNPIEKKKQLKSLMRKNRRTVVFEVINLCIQITVALMLWRIFETGLKGHDLYLIYDFMPDVARPFDLVFLGRYDLSQPSLTLNVMQATMIFLVETVSIISSPFPTNREEVWRLQFVLPVTSFFLFLFLPSGKKLFVIVTLLFSLGILLIKMAKRSFNRFLSTDEVKQQAVTS